MTITTPSGYKVTFKDETDLTYGDRRLIQKAFLKHIEDKDTKINGEIIFEVQEVTLKVILKAIVSPDGKNIEGDLFSEVMSWKSIKDGDAVFDVVNSQLNKDNSKKKTTK